MVDNFRAALADAVAPARCALCHREGISGLVCAECERALPWNQLACPGCALPQTHTEPCAGCASGERHYDSAWAAFRFAAPVQQSVHGLKYQAGFFHAQLLGSLMARRLSRRPQPLPQLIIPVPLHRERLRWRGYNQALELARVIASQCGIAHDARAVVRLRATEDQIGKTAAQRRGNVRNAFGVSTSLEGRHIALLDDVMTTGATLGELARVCRKAGAAKIEVWAAARVA